MSNAIDYSSDGVTHGHVPKPNVYAFLVSLRRDGNRKVETLTTSSWHMYRIQHPETRVIAIIGGNTDTVTVSSHHRCCFDSHYDRPIGCYFSEVFSSLANTISVSQ